LNRGAGDAGRYAASLHLRFNVNINLPRIVSIAALLFGSGFFVSALGQCNGIDKTNPQFFITYESITRVDDPPEGKHYRAQGLFRLHNNSNCTILVPTNDPGPSYSITLPGRERKLRRTDALTNGEKVTLLYDVYNERGANGTISVSYGDLVYDRALESGESIVFSVPLLHFKKGADIGVQFKYVSEDEAVSTMSGHFGHYVFFRNSFLPKDVLRR